MQLPHSTKSLVRGSMAAPSAYANSKAALRCAMRYHHNANMSTVTATSDLEALPHSLRPLCLAPFSCPRVSQSCPLCPLLTPTHTHAFPSPRTPSPRPRLPPPGQPILIRNVSANITSACPFVVRRCLPQFTPFGSCCRWERRCLARVACRGTHRTQDDRRCSP